jgi:hypothetical protein
MVMAKESVGGGTPENTPEETPAVVAEKAFDTAWGEASVIGEKAEISPADDPNKVPAGPEETPPVTPPKTEEKPAEPPMETPPVIPPVTPTPNDPSLQQPGESDETYKQRWLSLQGIHKHDKAAWETEKATLLADLEKARKSTPEPSPTATPVTPTTGPVTPAVPEDSLTQEEKDALKEYEQDFDVVSKMEGKKRDRELQKLRKEYDDKIKAIEERVNANLTNQLTPILKHTAETEQEAHFDAIREAHEDYETYVSDGSIVSWIESKPKYLQPALKETYSHGKAEDAIDLISDFKKETNIQPPAPVAQPDNVIPIDTKKAEKKAALSAVNTRKGAINQATKIADDYEGAWDEAMHK